ncbi:MAG TPA: hypothetical protein VF529_05395 [Solirubrobacteraceae bacterium]
MLRRTASLVALLAALGPSACGGDDDGGGSAPDRAETPAAQACPPETDQLLADAKQRMSHDDFDGAFAVMKRAADCPRVQERLVEYKERAAAKTLEIARRQLRNAHRRNDSPQAAVSLARNSLKYKETPQARAFYEKALRELNAFKRAHGEKPDEEPGGPPAGAGEGGPPEK